MENQNIFIFVLSHLFIIFILFKIRWKKSKSKSKLNLPPGPPKLPIIGNMHQLFTSSAPHQRLKELSEKYGSIMSLQLGEITNIVISSREIAKEIMKTHDLVFAQRPSVKATNIITYGSSDIVFSPYSDYWRQIRKICILEVLSAKRVQSFRSIQEEEGSNLMKTILSYSGESFNFSSMVFASTCGITARAVFGEKCKEQDEFRPLAQEIPQVLVKFNIADLFPSVKILSLFSGLSSIKKLHQELDRIFENIISQRKDSRKMELKDDQKGEEDNLLDVLLRVQEDGDLEFQLTDNNMKAVILVTRLKCGGFILGLRCNHMMSDGIGLAQFMSAIGEMARGSTSPFVLPTWERHLLYINNPPQVEHDNNGVSDTTNDPITHAHDLCYRAFFFGPTEISALRRLLPHDQQHCSSFEIVTAFVWKCRVVALEPHPKQEVNVIWAVSLRSNKLKHLIPDGYYGNALVLLMAKSTTKEIIENPLSYALQLIRNGNDKVNEDSIRSPKYFKPSIWSYSVSDLRHAGFENVDFGWGKAAYGGLSYCGPTFGYHVLFKRKNGENGIMLPLCLPTESMKRFGKELNRMFQTGDENAIKSKL